MNSNVIKYDPAERKFSYSINSQVIAIVPEVADKNEVMLLSELFQAGGNKMDEAYKKIKSLVDGKKEAVA